MRNALESAADNGTRHFVILSHNFEMLRQGRSEPDGIVVRRFEALCAFLAAHRDKFEVSTLSPAPTIDTQLRQDYPFCPSCLSILSIRSISGKGEPFLDIPASRRAIGTKNFRLEELAHDPSSHDRFHR